MQKFAVIDCIGELEELEETWRDARERTSFHLALMMESLAKSIPVMPSGKHMKNGMEHALGALIELSSVTAGLMEGMIRLLKGQLEDSKERENEEAGVSDQFVH